MLNLSVLSYLVLLPIVCERLVELPLAAVRLGVGADADGDVVVGSISPHLHGGVEDLQGSGDFLERKG